VAVLHLRPFALWSAFPASDYYGRSVTLGLAAFRRSRVPTSRTSERDVGPSFVPLNSLMGRRPAGGDFGRRNPYRPIPSAPPIPAVAEDVRFHPWGLRFKQSSLDLIARALRDDESGKFARPSLFDHALVPVGFRVRVRSMAQKRFSWLLLPAAGIRFVGFHGARFPCIRLSDKVADAFAHPWHPRGMPMVRLDISGLLERLNALLRLLGLRQSLALLFLRT
jgi:hypothetical protein